MCSCFVPLGCYVQQLNVNLQLFISIRIKYLNQKNIAEVAEECQQVWYETDSSAQ